MLHQNNFFQSDAVSKNMFYLEFSFSPSQDGKEQYCFHLSFRTTEAANEIVKRMKEQWSLPVSIEANRIIVQPAIDAQSPGVYLGSFESGDYVGIRFQDEKQANDFFNFAKPTIENKKDYSSIPEMTCKFGCIYFDKNKLIQPEYLIDVRAVQAHHINVMICALHQAFFSHVNNESKDIVCYLMRLLIMHEAGNEDLYFNRFVELNKQFALHNQKLLLPEQQKMNVSVKGVTLDGPDKYSMYLSCETPQQTEVLINHLKKCKMNSDKVFCTTIRIQPGLSSQMGFLPGVFCWDVSKISMDFDSAIEKYKFFQSIQIANVSYQSDQDGNDIVFEKDTLSVIHRNFDFNQNNIMFTRASGTHVKIKEISDDCYQWFTSLPLQKAVLVEGLQIFKVNDHTLSFGEGRGLPGVQIKNASGIWMACNNKPADDKFASFDERKAHLKNRLDFLDKMIDSNKKQYTQAQQIRVDDVSKQNDNQGICTIS